MTDDPRIRDVSNVVELVEALQSCAGPEAFPAELAAGISGVIGCDHVSVGEIDNAGRWIGGDTYPDSPTLEEHLALRRLLPSHPIVSHYLQTADRSVRSLSDFWSQRELRRSTLYGQYYRARDIRYQIAAVVGARRDARTALVL